MGGLGDERARLAEQLRALGAPDGAVTQALDAAMARSLAVQLLVNPVNRLTLGEVAERAGARVEDAERLWRAWGFPPPAADDRRFGQEDVELLRFSLAIEALVGRDVAFHTSRVMGMAVTRIAEAEVAMIRSTIEAPLVAEGGDLADVVGAFAGVVQGMLGPTRDTLDALHRHCLVEVARRHDAMGVDASPVNRMEAVVGFADLTGSSRLAIDLPLDEFDRTLSRFEEHTSDLIADHGAVLVKRIGDAVMFTAPTTRVAVDVALALVDAFADDPLVPEVRVALAVGTVVACRGDYYGRPVNLAARLEGVAKPSTVLVAEEVRLSLGEPEDLRVEPVGSLHLAGFADPVPAFAVTRAGDLPG